MGGKRDQHRGGKPPGNQLNDGQPPQPSTDGQQPPAEQKPKPIGAVVKPRTLTLVELIQRACAYSITDDEQIQIRDGFTALLPTDPKLQATVAKNLAAMPVANAVGIIRSLALNPNQDAAQQEINLLTME